MVLLFSFCHLKVLEYVNDFVVANQKTLEISNTNNKELSLSSTGNLHCAGIMKCTDEWPL